VRLVIVWIVVSVLLAVAVSVAVSEQYPPRVATWVLISVSVAAGLGAMSRSVESAPTRDGKELLLSILRPALSVAAGVATLLSTALAGCNDEGGVPDWERCVTFWGTLPSSGQEYSYTYHLLSLWGSAISSGGSLGDCY